MRVFFPLACGDGFRISTEIIWSGLLNSLEMWSFNVCFRLYKYSWCFRMWFYDIQRLEITALQHFLFPLLTSASVPLCHDLLLCCFYQHHQVVQLQYKLVSFGNQTCIFLWGLVFCFFLFNWLVFLFGSPCGCTRGCAKITRDVGHCFHWHCY